MAIEPFTPIEFNEKKQPKLLNMRVYSAHSEKPVFYGFPGQSQIYSARERQWIQPPPYLEDFAERELGPTDLADVVMHGLMDDEDYNELDSVQLIDPVLKQLFCKIKELNSKIQTLTDAVENVEEEHEEIDDELEKTDEETVASVKIEGEVEPTGALVELIKKLAGETSISGGVFEQIVGGIAGLSNEEKAVLKLVGQHFNLNSKDEKPNN